MLLPLLCVVVVVCPGLLAMTDKILELLNGRHFEDVTEERFPTYFLRFAFARGASLRKSITIRSDARQSFGFGKQSRRKTIMSLLEWEVQYSLTLANPL
jgi:hypothetical protein